jgi:hypothetical protein
VTSDEVERHTPAVPAAPHDVEPSALAELEAEERTARQGLMSERRDALDRQARMAGWFMLFGVGPAALVSILLALATGRPDLIWPFFGLGVGVQLWRIWKEQRRIKEIERELEDPIDGS